MTLENLKREFPLPDGWTNEELVTHGFEERGFRLELAAVTAEGSGMQLFGSAAEQGELPLARAYFELVERVSVVTAEGSGAERFDVFDCQGGGLAATPSSSVFPKSDQPAVWRFAKSNGVAVALSFADAARSSYFELLERDRILRSWAGEICPVRIQAPLSMPECLEHLYEFETYRFTPASSHAAVVGLFGFPKQEHAPMVYAFGAETGTEGAFARARKEFYQRLGFLWGEVIPSEAPAFEPTALYHQEYFLVPAHRQHLRRWLSGEGPESRALVPEIKDVSFACLTPPNLKGKLYVLKAFSPKLLPLRFGKWQQGTKHAAADQLDRFIVHPIP